ncbi:MAG: fused MFS/spermidine synthase [Chloroflexi bacterium]|nr:fused MFS/spermidine synthase [Chloroflexota bacterium]
MAGVARERGVAVGVVAPARPAELALWQGNLLAFVASCASLVLELVAGRMLAPFVGVSLYTWTSIIGVVLAGISLGNWFGGRLADRRASQRLLGLLFLAGGAASLATLAIVGAIGDGALFKPLPILARIFVLTTFTFFLPSLLLGMVTPVAIRLSLADLRRTGRVVGMIYAFGTAGSLAGNFLTGFVLIAYLPVNTIGLIVGATLLIVGALLRILGSDHVVAAQRGAAPSQRSSSALSATTGRATGLELRGNVGLACAVVVVSSFCTMAVELAASRILAPSVGLSLYSWTGIIGTVLAGITGGNYLGGWIADRWPSQRVLGICLFLGGLATFYIVVMTVALEAAGPNLRLGSLQLGLMERIVAIAAGIFFVPVMFLGMISPQVIRLTVTDVAHAGRVSGQIYAWSTAGAIAGTFATGWWLISALGVHALVFAMGIGLLGLALSIGRFWRPWPLLAGSGAVAGLAITALALNGSLASTCVRETDYYCIRVREESGNGFPIRTLVLDHLIHSYVKLGDPSYLGYAHEYAQSEITRYQFARTGSQRVLVVGGGGYTYPRWVEWAIPQSAVEVVEIDPGVTEVGHDYLGLSRDTGIITHSMDGRQFVHEQAPKGQYALVVQDAVNDLSVPYHIMTREYNDQVRALLVPDGAYLLTVIDLYRDGQLLRSAVRTMMQTFPSVQLLATGRPWEVGGASVWVIAGSERGLDLEQMRQVLSDQGVGPMRTTQLEPERLQAYVAEGPRIILTDQYAPVDNLIAILFQSRG